MDSLIDDIAKPAQTKEEPHTVNFTAQDILASLGFEAQRIAAAVAQHAQGAPFPDPCVIKQLIYRMGHLNETLIRFGAFLTQPAPTEMRAEGGMTVKMDN